MRHDLHHTGYRSGCLFLDCFDPTARDGTVDDEAIQHAGRMRLGGIAGLSRHLGEAINPGNGLSNFY